MKILILEGIATSGKSTVTKCIKERFADLTVRTVSEEETHIPIMKQTDERHEAFFKDLIERVIAEKSDLIIFDRLYLTQAFRAGVNLAGYNGVEDLLSQHDVLTVFLKVDERAIAARVAKAAEHRESAWGEYIKTKGANASEIADYYGAQQRNQIKLLQTSMLPYIVCDTTHHDYDGIVKEILETLRLK